MWKLLVPIAVLAALVLAPVLSEGADEKADFTFINRGDVSTLDLQKMSWMQDLRVARILFEGLVANDIFARDYRVQPRIAERWEISPDSKTYRFYLRAGARWSNGEPVTADDFVFSWRRGLTPETVSDYAAQFQLIKGGAAYFEWRNKRLEEIAGAPPGERRALAANLPAESDAKFTELVGLRSLEEGRVLEVTLERPTPYFLELCAFAVFYPVYPPLVTQYEKPDPETGRLDVQSGWTKPGKLVSNGPFTLKRWRFKRDLRCVKSETYWNRESIAIDSIEIPSVEDPSAQVLAFTTGAVDWTSDVTPPYRRDIVEEKREFYREIRGARRAWEESDRSGPEPVDIDALMAAGVDPVEIDARLPDDPRKNIHTFPAFGTYFYNFNCRDKLADGRDNPFKHRLVRKAFAMAIDKERIVREVRGVGEKTASTLVPRDSIEGYPSPKGLGYDPAEARRILAQAGFPGGAGLPTIEIFFNKDAGHDVIAQAIAKDWQEHLGVSVSLQQREIKVFRNDLKKQNYMTGRAGWFGDYGDPTSFLDLNRTDDGNNDRKYSSAVYDGLLDKAAVEPDPKKRLEILAEAERLIIEEDVPLVPLFQYVQMYLFDPDEITGISSHPRQQQDMYLVDRFGDGKGPDVRKIVPAPGENRDSRSTDSSEQESVAREPAR